MSEQSKNVAIYARCSTSRDQNPQVQLTELRRYCQARGWKIACELIDHGFSGKTDQRPGLKELLAAVRSRQVDAVVVVKLDRLFRSLKHLVVTLHEFTDLGVDFVSLKDQIDLTTASGRLLMHLLASFSEFERELIVERTMAGLDHARAKGKHLGRPKTVDDDAIREAYQQGMSFRTIMRELGCSMGAVNRALGGAPKTGPKIAEESDVSTRGSQA